jgi:hypothetical protein
MSNNGKPWTRMDEEKLARLLLAGLTEAKLASKFGRSVFAIRAKAHELEQRAADRVSRYAVRRDSPLQLQR